MVPSDTVIELPRGEGSIAAEPDVDLFYRTVGAGEQTVIVLHGGPGFSLEYFLPDLQPLARRRRLVLFDQRSSGRSTLLDDDARNTLDDFIEDLDRIRRAFELETVILLGHSWGSYLAGAYAAEHPDRVDRMVLVGSSPPAMDIAIDGFSPAERIPPAHRRLLSTHHEAHQADCTSRRRCWDYWSILGRGYHSTPADAQRNWGDICARPPATFESDQPRAGLGFRDELPDLRPRLGAVEAPTLVVHCDDGPIPNTAAHAWADALPASTPFIMPTGGHLPWVDQPAVFFPAVDAFLRGVTPEPPTDVDEWTPPTDIPAPPGDLHPHDELFDAIETASKAYAAAINEGDWGEVGAHFTEDAMVLGPSSPPAARRTAIAAFWEVAHARGLREVELQTVEVEGIADRAFELGKYVVHGEASVLVDHGKFMVHWRQTDNGWRIYRDIFNSSLDSRSPLERPHHLPPPDGTFGVR